MIAAPPPSSASPRPFLTMHALDRCREMGVTRAEVVDALERFDVRYPSTARYGPGRFVSTRARLAVVHTATREVITVLWNGQTSREQLPRTISARRGAQQPSPRCSTHPSNAAIVPTRSV